MSFSKAKLKRFNDIEVCSSPAAAKLAADAATTTTAAATAAAAAASGTTTPTPIVNGGSTNSIAALSTASSSSSTAQPERKEQIEKFFKDAVRFATSAREAKEFAIPKDGVSVAPKEEKKSKGLRLFRTPSLPHRLRFRHNYDAPASTAPSLAAVNPSSSGASTACSTPLHSAATTPVKELPKSASRLKGKEALQHEIRKKNELLESYLSQMDVLKRHVEQLKEAETTLREEHANADMRTEQLIQALTAENHAHKERNNQLDADHSTLVEKCTQMETELKAMTAMHAVEIEALNSVSQELRANQERLEQELQQELAKRAEQQEHIKRLEQEIAEAREKIAADEERAQQNSELIKNLRNTNEALIADVSQLKQQIECDALDYAQEKIAHNEMECLKNERNTLKADLASKCARISTLQDEVRAARDELLDKECEIDAHQDNIRQLCREKAAFAERERKVEDFEERMRLAETTAEQKLQKIESDLETVLETEKAYWRSELDKRQQQTENELIRLELEKQDVMLLLETTNEMLRARNEQLEKYEEQLRVQGIDYYVQLTDNLQKQVVDLKKDFAKTISENHHYQLTLNNTRATVNILMERLKKSDTDFEQYKAELESLHLEKAALEQSCLALQSELELLRAKDIESEAVLRKLQQSTQTLQNEVSIKEKMFNEILTSEEETLAKFNKIASSFQTRIDMDAAHYHELRTKDESRDLYMQELKKALDEFATVVQYAQLELDSKEKVIVSAREECEQLKLENISLKSKLDEAAAASAIKRENSTDLEKISDLLIDSELRAECDKITSWLLCGGDKSVRNDSSNEINDLLRPSTPNNSNKSRSCTTPVRSSGGARTASSAVNTPRTPRTPKTTTTTTTSSHTPRTTPKKTVLFPGKENVPSPQKQVLKARNV